MEGDSVHVKGWCLIHGERNLISLIHDPSQLHQRSYSIIIKRDILRENVQNLRRGRKKKKIMKDGKHLL